MPTKSVQAALIEHRQYIERYGEGAPEITGWRWSGVAEGGARRTSTAADNV